VLGIGPAVLAITRGRLDPERRASLPRTALEAKTRIEVVRC